MPACLRDGKSADSKSISLLRFHSPARVEGLASFSDLLCLSVLKPSSGGFSKFSLGAAVSINQKVMLPHDLSTISTPIRLSARRNHEAVAAAAKRQKHHGRCRHFQRSLVLASVFFSG